MNKLNVLSVLAAIVFSVSIAQAQDYYVGLSGRIGGQFGDGPGASLGGHFGAAFNGIRAEAEIAHTAIANYNIFSGGDKDATSFMANGYYDFDTGSPLKPYIGAGIGIALAHIRDQRISGNGAEDDDIVFAFQAMGGVGYEILPSTTIFGGYKYFGTTDVTVGTLSENISFHSIEIGVRYSF
jgi:opacity protein-like surface antigen